MNAYIKIIYTKNTFVKNIELWILANLRITLTDLRVNNCCFWLFIGLIFALIDSVSYWDIERLNLDLRSIYVFNVKYIFLYLQKLFLFQIGNYLLIIRLAKL